MTDRDLTRLLEGTATRIPTKEAPTGRMIGEADRILRRRRRVGTSLAAVAVAVVVVGVSALLPVADGPSSTNPLDKPTPTASADPAPPGTRLVGIGHAAVAVPKTWSTNTLSCGEPTEPTVVIDLIAIEACARSVEHAHDTIWVELNVSEQMVDLVEAMEIDGVSAQRDAPRCTRLQGGALKCSARVLVPSENVSFRAQASTKERVEEILSWIRIVPDHVAVPGYQSLGRDQYDRNVGELYRSLVEDAGLEAKVITEPTPDRLAGNVLGVNPAPGTMLATGQVVTVTVAVAASSANENQDSAPTTVVLTGDGGRSARIAGKVSLLGNCAGIGDAVAVWPTGTTVVQDRPLVLDVPGLGRVQEGQKVIGGGGLFDTSIDNVGVTIPPSCGTKQGVTFWVP